MQRHIARAVVVAVMTCATALTAIAPAVAHDLDTDRFQVKVRGGNGHYEDVGRDGPSIGDYTVFRERVYHRGDRVGRNNGHCDVTRAGAGRFAYQCNLTMFLRGRGQISMQGLFAFGRRGPGLSGDEATVAITGGTGIYNHAGGTATIVARPDEPVRYRIDMR
jgi:hypothetical protein